MLVLDGRRRIRWCSPALAALLGRDADGLVGLHGTELLHPDDRRLDDELFAGLVEGTIPRFRLRKRFLADPPGILWATTSFRAAPDGADGPRAHVWITPDPRPARPSLRPVAPAPSRVDAGPVVLDAARFREALALRLARCPVDGTSAALVVLGVGGEHEGTSPQDDALLLDAARAVLSPSCVAGRLAPGRVAVLRTDPDPAATRDAISAVVLGVARAHRAAGGDGPSPRVTAASCPLDRHTPGPRWALDTTTRALERARIDGDAHRVVPPWPAS